jgi:DNA-binding CsgD family transcriptional regulator
MAAIETGDVREAERLLGRVRQTLGGRDWSYFFQYTRYGEALLDWQLGRPAECVAVLADVADRLVKMEARALSVFVLTDLADSAVDARDAQAAAAAAGLLDDVARIADLPPHYGLAAAAAAWASLAAHDPAGAAAKASEAIGLLSGAGWRSHLGRAHDLLGRALAAAGRPGAVTALEEAVAIFDRCGAVWRRDRSIEVLRRLGSSGRRAAAAALGPVSLTRREREVARLAARGMSTKAIADALFVGERTVESHLSSTYAKLGVGSRLDLVRRAAELGLSRRTGSSRARSRCCPRSVPPPRKCGGRRSSTAGAPQRAAAPASAATRAERTSARTSSSWSQSTWTGGPCRPESDRPRSTSPTCTTAPSR